MSETTTKRPRRLTAKQLYREKVRIMTEEYKFKELEPKEFYRRLFPEGSFEQKGEHVIGHTGKPNGILVQIDPETHKTKHRLLTDDLDWVDEFKGQENVILSPIGYYGKRRTSHNASYLYALVFDLDGQGIKQFRDTIHQMVHKWIPFADIIVLSGHGLHLYYLFEFPIPMYPEYQKELNKLKTGLTQRIWNSYTSTAKIQFQPIAQGFRMVGSASKLGKRYPVRAFLVSDSPTMPEFLSEFIPDSDGYKEYRSTFNFCDKTPIEEAKEKWPAWYERRVVQGKKRGRWYVKRALYDWWLARIRDEATVGHRYFALMTLAVMAMKCNIDYSELERDAYSLLDPYESITETDDNHFTEHDVECALQAYQEPSNTYPRDTIAKLAGIRIEPNKRNYRPQELHLKGIRALQEIYAPNWRANGRPKGSKNKTLPKKELVENWRAEHPNGKKIECYRALKISRTTIDKYWNPSTE